MANEPIITGTSFCLVTDHAPGPLDSDYGEQFFWLDTVTGRLYFSVDLTPDDADWKEVTFVS